MRLLFLNQYFPPDPAPTGVLLAEVADTLRSAGHEVELISAAQDYRGGQAQGGRMRREAQGLAQILQAGVRAQRPDVVVSGTSPPCLLAVATMIAMRHRARSIHWAMDLYPELALALGEIPPGALAGGLSALMRWCYRRTDRTLALDEDMAAHLARLGARVEVIRPWVFATVWEAAQRAQAAVEGSAPAPREWRWIYSGNLGRAHEWQTLLDVQQRLEQEGAGIRLIFQGGGPSWAAAQEYGNRLGLRSCEWRPYVPETDLPATLLDCDATVVTQRPEVQGLLWPSKLGLLLGIPRPILFVGPPDGAIARELRGYPHSGIFPPSAVEPIAQWLVAQKEEERGKGQWPAFDAAAHRRDTLAQWKQLVAEMAAKLANAF